MSVNESVSVLGAVCQPINQSMFSGMGFLILNLKTAVWPPAKHFFFQRYVWIPTAFWVFSKTSEISYTKTYSWEEKSAVWCTVPFMPDVLYLSCHCPHPCVLQTWPGLMYCTFHATVPIPVFYRHDRDWCTVPFMPLSPSLCSTDMTGKMACSQQHVALGAVLTFTPSHRSRSNQTASASTVPSA